MAIFQSDALSEVLAPVSLCASGSSERLSLRKLVLPFHRHFRTFVDSEKWLFFRVRRRLEKALSRSKMEYSDRELSMGLDRLTTASINVMGLARVEAQNRGWTYVDVEHISLGLLAEHDGIAYHVLMKNGLQLREARTQMAKQTKEEKLAGRKNFALTDKAKKVLTTAERIADEHQKERVDTEFLLLAVLQEKNWRTRDVLDNFGIDVKRLRADVENEISMRVESPIKASAEVLTSTTSDTTESQKSNPPKRLAGPFEVAHSSPDFAAPIFHAFTDPAIKVIIVAQEESKLLGHNFVGSEQLLLGLLQDAGIAGNQFHKLSVSVMKARREVEKIIGRGSGYIGFEVPYTPHAKSILLDATDQAKCLGNKLVGAEHLLLALLAYEDCVATCILQNLDVDIEQLRGNVLNAI